MWVERTESTRLAASVSSLWVVGVEVVVVVSIDDELVERVLGLAAGRAKRTLLSCEEGFFLRILSVVALSVEVSLPSKLSK